MSRALRCFSPPTGHRSWPARRSRSTAAWDCIDVQEHAAKVTHIVAEDKMSQDNCVYCSATAESVVWSDALCRVIHVADAKFAGFCRVVWGTHVAEFSDLDDEARTHVMRVVAAVEKGLRD